VTASQAVKERHPAVWEHSRSTGAHTEQASGPNRKTMPRCEILEKKVQDFRRRIRVREDRLRQRKLLPDGDALEADSSQVNGGDAC
jgi:hypothetical protein